MVNRYLKNISCTINKGDFIVIVGPNGAGKSTFFDMISGKAAFQQVEKFYLII